MLLDVLKVFVGSEVVDSGLFLCLYRPRMNAASSLTRINRRPPIFTLSSWPRRIMFSTVRAETSPRISAAPFVLTSSSICPTLAAVFALFVLPSCPPVCRGFVAVSRQFHHLASRAQPR